MDAQAITAWGTVIIALLIGVAILIRWDQAKTQTKILSDQFKIRRSQVVPYITVGGLKVEGDDIIAELTNQSDVGAYWIGLKTQFFQVIPRYYGSKEDRQTLNMDQVHQYEKEGKTVYVKYFLVPWEKLVFNSEMVKPKGIINFSADMPTPVFAPPEHKHAKFHPLFGIKSNDGSWSQTLDFAKLREFLSQNNVPYAALSFTVVYKDITETPLGSETADAFVCIVEEHKTLQQAWKKHYTVDFIGLSPGEILTKLKYVDEDWYDHTWSSWNLSGPLDRL